MKDKKLHLIWKASGYLDAQLIKNYLGSYGIDVYDFEESVGKTFGFTAGPLGEVELYVPKDKAQEAEEKMKEYLESAADPQEEENRN